VPAKKTSTGASQPAVRGKPIAPEILEILQTCTVADNILRIEQQLERNTYLAVSKVLDSIGGKWNKKLRGHVFADGDAETLLQGVLMSGEMVDLRKHLQFFPTPNAVGERMCQLADLRPSHVVLEPSAGRGDLARCIQQHASVEVIEQHQPFRTELQAQGFHVLEATDFLEYTGSPERIVMNPPFARQQDLAHVLHAHDVLAPGGVLVSVTTPSWQYRVDRRSQDFRAWFKTVEGTAQDLPEASFRESGTNVRAQLVKIQKEN
jgi:hypothetical protein